MAGESRELKFKLALEYDAGGLGKFRSDVESVTLAARGASGDLDELAVGIDSVADSAADLGATSGRVEASLSDVARAGDETRESLADVATATEEMSVAQARAAVAQSKLAQAGREVDAAQSGLVAAVSKYGAESSQAEQATKGLADAEKKLASASKDAEAALKAVGDVDLSGPEQGATSLGDRLAGLGDQLSGLGDGSPLSGLGDMFGDVGGKAGQAGQLVSGLSGSLSGLAGGTSIVGGLSSGFTTLAASINPATLAVGALAIAGVAAGKALLDAGHAALDMQQGVASATAKFGLLEDEAQALGDVGLEVWRNNWGTSIEETTVRAGQLRAVLGDMASGELTDLTQQSFAFEQVFGKGIEDQQLALKPIVENFKELGGDGAVAFDILTAAMQRTGDPADDLKDTFAEYSPLFADMGFSAAEFAGILEQGLDAGARNTDIVADLFKEFGIRIRDGSDLSKEALADLNLSHLTDDLASGKIQVKDAFSEIQAAILSIEDPLEREAAGVALFGTQWEDAGRVIIDELDVGKAAITDFEGATLAAGNAINQNFGSAWEGLTRNLSASLVPLVMPFVDALRGPAIEAVNLISSKITDFAESATFDGLVAGAKALGSVLGFLLSSTVKLGGVLYDAFFRPTQLIADIGEQLGLFSEETADFVAILGSPMELAATGWSALGGALGLVKEETDALAPSAEEAAVAQERVAATVDPLTAELDNLTRGLQDGSLSTEAYATRLLELKDAGAITEEQFASLSQNIASGLAPLSDTLSSFGVGIDMEALADPEKFLDSINEANEAAHEAITGLYSEQLQAREQFATDEQALIDKGGQAVSALLAKQAQERSDLATKQAREEATAAENPERLAKVREQNALELQDLAVKHERALADQYQANADGLTALQEGFEQERQARIAAIAQAALDQVNSMLSLGQITEDQAQVIFGSLKAAAPDSALFDPAAEAALSFSATLGRAVGGSIEDAVALGDELRNIDTALDNSQAHATQYADESVAAYEAARIAVESSASGAITAADIEGETNLRRIVSHQEVDATIVESGNIRAGVRLADADSSLVTTDAELADNERRKMSLTETAGVTEGEFGRMSSAHTAAAGVSKSASDDMVSSTQRIAGEAQATAGVVDQSVGRIGGTFMTSAAGVKVGADGIITNVGAANQSLSSLGTGVPSSLAPATDSVLKLRGGVQLLADDVDAAAQIQISAQDDAARAATGASDDTVEGFSAVQEQGVDTREEIVALREAMEQLPKRIDIPLAVPGIEKVQAIFTALEADIEALQTAATIRIYGEYIPKDPAMAQGGSIQLQHDIEDAISAADPGIYLAGTYDGTGGMMWTGDGLAITDALAELQEMSRLGLGDDFARLLFDPSPEAAAELARLASAIVETSAALVAAQAAAAAFDESRLEETITRITGAFNAWFTDSEKVAGSLRSTLALFAGGGMAPIDEGSFLNSLGFDEATFAELQARIASLSGEPEKQREMWQAVVGALQEDWGRFYDQQKAGLDAQKKGLEEQVKAAKAASPDANTDALDKQIEAVEASIQALDERNRSIADGLSLQGDGLDRMLDAYKRVADEQERLAKAEEAAGRAREAAVKALQDDIKARQKAAEDAEKSAHDQAMDLLEDEMKRRERAHDLEMRALDDKKKWLEADIKSQNEAEEKAHEARLAAITAEVDKRQKFLDVEEERLTRAKLLIDTIEAGNAITAADEDFLRSLGIDPATLVKTNAELAKTETEIDKLTRSIEALSGLFDKLPDEIGRVRLAAGGLSEEFGRRPGSEGPQITAVTDAERKRLEDLSAGGTLSKADQRIVDLFLAGRVVQAQRLRGILGPVIEAEEGELETKEKAVDLAKQEVDEAGKLLAKRDAAMKLAQHDNDVVREGLQEQIRLENERYEKFKEDQAGRLEAIDIEKRALDDAYKAEKEAIAEAKELEEDRHRARMKAIDEEYALELLRAGKTDDEVQRILAEQKERAAAIADEAERRFNEMMASAAAARTPVVVPVDPGARPPGIKPPPTPIPGTPVLPGDPGRGIKGPRPLGLGADTEALIPIGDVFPGLDGALDRMDDLHAQAVDIAGLFASDPGAAAFMGGGTANIDNGRHFTFNGDVYIDHEVAEELGLYDAARLGAP